MKSYTYIPNSLRSAGNQLRIAFANPVERLSKQDFIRAWNSIAYLFPGLHPDGYKEAGSGWPRKLRRYAAEAWSRAENGMLMDEELYPSDAAWAGLYDRMQTHTSDENKRRKKLADLYGDI